MDLQLILYFFLIYKFSGVPNMSILYLTVKDFFFFLQ